MKLKFLFAAYDENYSKIIGYFVTDSQSGDMMIRKNTSRFQIFPIFLLSEFNFGD